MQKNNLLNEVMQMGRVKANMGILKLSDEEAYKHCVDVAMLAQSYLEIEMSMDFNKRTDEERKSIIAGALLHDIGKAFLPFGLQYSTGTFSPEEREIMKMHPILGYVAIQNCEYNEIVNNIVLMHHANMNGTGYPKMGEKTYGVDIEVPEYVWIVSYADRLDAMISKRTFKRQKSLNEAWKILVDVSKNGELPYAPLLIYKEVIRDMDIFKGGNYETA